MAESFIKVDGLKTRYLEEGSGAEVLLLHGASLGSSADVWERNLAPLASHGLRAIAFDHPGFGLTDNPKDYSVAYRRRFILQFMDALGIRKAHLVGHSQAGGMAVGLAFDHTDRIGKVVVLATGSVLPPLPEGGKSGPGEGEEGGRFGADSGGDARAIGAESLQSFADHRRSFGKTPSDERGQKFSGFLGASKSAEGRRQ